MTRKLNLYEFQFCGYESCYTKLYEHEDIYSKEQIFDITFYISQSLCNSEIVKKTDEFGKRLIEIFEFKEYEPVVFANVPFLNFDDERTDEDIEELE